MKEIKLTQGRVTLVSDEDFEALDSRSWAAYRIAGTGRNGDVHLYGFKAGYRLGGRKYWMHNLIMCPSAELEVDHIDGNPLNNQRTNLRVVTHRKNCQNRRRQGKSIYHGVSWHTGKASWRVIVDKKFVGWFRDEVDAATAWNFAVEFSRNDNLRWNTVPQPWAENFLNS